MQLQCLVRRGVSNLKNTFQMKTSLAFVALSAFQKMACVVLNAAEHSNIYNDAISAYGFLGKLLRAYTYPVNTIC